MRLQIISLSVKLLRIFVYKAISVIRACRNLNYQMFSKQSIQNAYNSLNRSKRFVLIGVVALVILLYLWPSWLNFRTTAVIDQVAVCISAKVSTYNTRLGQENVITKHALLHENEKPFISYVGNGYIGTTVHPRSRLHVKYGRILAVPINFYPVISVDIEGFQYQEANVTSLLEGVVSRVQCFKVDDRYCMSVSADIYAHRTRPSVLVQEIKIHNPSDKALTLELSQIGLSGWEGATTVSKRADQLSSTVLDYTVTTGTVKPREKADNSLLVGVASVKLPESVTVQATSTWRHSVLTAVKYQVLNKSASNAVAKQREDVAKEVEEELGSVLIINNKLLRDEHEEAWKQLWHSGFGISQSLAPGAVNGNSINMSIYYVLSQCRSPIHNPLTSDSQRQELNKLLYFPDRCYEGHHTLQNAVLWDVPTTIKALNDLVKVWIITLEKQGCKSMLNAGADGVLQAMLLSLGPLQFKNDHLEFRTHPRDLHRDYVFRRINYGNNTHLNISVIVGDDNKAVLMVALDRNDKQFYACDAGCLDPPVQLSREVVKFPVKLTDPLTAILYITYDKPHIEELRHAIHVKEIAEAPAHEHHVMALHRHGHHLGGLPMLFWGSIAFLILTFHMFLFKLVYNEYCSGSQDSRYTRTRYSL